MPTPNPATTWTGSEDIASAERAGECTARAPAVCETPLKVEASPRADDATTLSSLQASLQSMDARFAALERLIETSSRGPRQKSRPKRVVEARLAAAAALEGIAADPGPGTVSAEPRIMAEPSPGAVSTEPNPLEA
eukprot:374192-Prymnesium_polylepis.1